MNSKSLQHLRFKGLPLVLMLTLSLALAGGFYWMSSTSKASANFPDKSLAEATYPNIVGSRIDNCSLCHTSAPNLNPYGAAYLSKGRGSATSLTSIENVDSDLDGATNIQEIMALTFPGDPKDFPPVPVATNTATPTTPPPTATKTNTPTTVPPTAGPTSTHTPTTVPPTAGPTATKTATSVSTGPTATKTATSISTGPTATKAPTSTKPAATATKVISPTKTPGGSPTPIVQCVKDDDHKSTEKDSTDHGRTNPCPRGYHPRGSDGEDHKSGDDFFTQVIKKISTLIKGKKP